VGTGLLTRRAGLLVAAAGPSFDPSTISGLEIWLKGNDLVGADGAAIATWADASGNGRDATQATAGFRPLKKVAVLNGKNVARFDGTDDIMGMGDLTAGPFLTGAASVFVVVTINTDVEWSAYATDATGDFFLHNSGNSYFGAHRADRPNMGAFGMPTTGSHLVTIESSASSYDIRLDGVAVHSEAANFTSGAPIVTVGGATGGGLLNGDVAELLVYSAVLSAGNRAAVEAYLQTKYGL
jgi:hypothetical protein